MASAVRSWAGLIRRRWCGGSEPPGGEQVAIGEMNGLVAEYVAHTRCAAACLREGSRVEKRDTAVEK
ncbi:hypothetical protein [Amycolatopsis echigonensis]|uniref:hypothetical protein n=1 Tax=Amycolatopsis echigonensis TaxID=2576905 RepID=UPI001178C8DD|nr:hypothetical protein [Amycolatopsis niigatensis]